MFIKRGTILSLKELNADDCNSINKRDVNIFKNIIETIKPSYLICLRKIDENHFLCAYIKHKIGKRSLCLKMNNTDLWVNYASFCDINSCFLQIENQSNPYFCEVVSKIYMEHNRLMNERNQKKQEDKKAKKELHRKQLEVKRHESIRKKERKLHGNQADPRTNNNPITYLNYGNPSRKKSENAWWNVHHPISCGRGNF